jgi:hypothetical protein
MKAVKDADPAGIVEEECLDICGGFDSILSSFRLFGISQYIKCECVCAGGGGRIASKSQKT